MPYHQTPHCAIILQEEGGLFTPHIYPWTIRVRSCANRSAKHAFKCALKWLDQADVVARRELIARGWIQPIPEPGPSLYAGVPEEAFEDYTGE